MRIFQTKLQDSILMNYSLSDMVREIVKKPTVFKGRSYIIINKIKTIKNNSTNGLKEINEAWDIAKNGSKEAQRKTNKYFMEGTKASENYFLKPTEQPLSTQEVKIEKRKNILDKEVARKACDDDFSNHSIKKITPIEGDAKNDVTIEKMGPCEGVIDKPKNEVVGEKANSFTRGFSIIKNKLNHQNSSENEPKPQRILPSDTIEEAIKKKWLLMGFRIGH